MKKITLLLIIAVFAFSAVSAQSTFKWYGAQTDQIWDYATANWIDPSFPIPLPKTFSEGSNAIFDDTAMEGSDTLKINGVITVNDWSVNASRTYVMRSTAVSTDSIVGTGTLTKEGEGLLVMDLNNKLQGGTIIKAGTVMMEKQTTPNIFGAKIVFQGGTANFATTSSSSYPSISVPIEIPEGVTGKVELSRYSYFASPVSGAGDLVIAAGGERTMMGTSKSGNVYVDWSNFTGNVTVEPYVMSGVNPGYRAVLLPITQTFRSETLAYSDSIYSTVDTMFAKRKLTLKAGAGLTGASGTRCWAIGELQAEDETAFLGGYGAGKSNSPKIFYMIGGLNTDVVCPVSLNDVGGGDYNYFGIVKVGTGKYVFTGTKSVTQAFMGVQVVQGTFLVDIPVTTSTTALARCKSTVMTINANAIGGGNGRLTGKVQVDSLGTLVIGNGAIGELVLGDTEAGNLSSAISAKAGSTIEFKIASTSSYDKISSNSSANLDGSKFLLKAEAGYDIKEGDMFTLISASSGPSTPDSILLETSGFGEQKFTLLTDTVGGGYRVIAYVGTYNAVKNVSQNLVKFFPNPSNGIIQLSGKNNEIKSIEIVNLQGQVVYASPVNSLETSLNLTSLSAGIYYAKVQIGDAIEVNKIILK